MTDNGEYRVGRPAPRLRKHLSTTKRRSEMKYVFTLVLVSPVRYMMESSPAVKAAGLLTGGLAGFIWGEAFLVLFMLYGATSLWDWILGGQLASRISRVAEAQGIDPVDVGGFDSEIARSGLLVKVSLAIQITILFVGELWVLQTLAVRYIDILPSVFHSIDFPENMAVMSSTIMAAACLNELRSCERNRRMLGGSRIPVFSNAMDLMDKIAQKVVPPADPEEHGWHKLPEVDEKRGARGRRRKRKTRDRDSSDNS